MKNSPLNGIRIVDLTHNWSGPHCTRVLADFGAEVIRIEYVRRLDLFRGGKTEDRNYDKQPIWYNLNRNKLAITLDLKQDEDRAVFMDLVKAADVVVENGRTGVMNGLGFGYADLSAIRPNIIMLSMPAYGSSGPYASYPAYGAALEAMSGIQNLTAYAADTKPHRIREMDVVNGIGAVCAVMTSLLYRQQTGEGQYIDLSQMEFPTHALLGEHLLEFAMNKEHASPMGNRHRHFILQGCYRCKGKDKWVAISVRTKKEWQKFCHIIGQSELAMDERFASQKARYKNHDELDQLIERWTILQEADNVMHVLQDHAIPSTVVYDPAGIVCDPHLRQRDYFIKDVSDSSNEYMGMPFKLSRGAGRIRWRGPDLGHHNEDVLCKLLGYSKNRVKSINIDNIGTAYDPE